MHVNNFIYTIKRYLSSQSSYLPKNKNEIDNLNNVHSQIVLYA